MKDREQKVRDLWMPADVAQMSLTGIYAQRTICAAGERRFPGNGDVAQMVRATDS